MKKITRRNLVAGGAGTVLATVAAPSVVSAQTRRWRMVTSWPRRLPGPGMSAERIAERLRALSGGRLELIVSAAGEVVPAFEVLDAVGSGVAEMGHTAAFYWQGKQPRRRFSPRFRSASRHWNMSPGWRPAAAKRSGMSSMRRLAQSPLWVAILAYAWAAGSVVKCRVATTCAG